MFIRGKNSLTALQTQERLRNTAFILLSSPEFLPHDITGYLGTFNLIEEIYHPIGQHFLKHEYQPQTIRELELALPQLNYAQILNALVILSHLGFAQPCQSITPSEKVTVQCQQLNHYLIQQANFHQNYQALISPLTGIGIPTEHFHQLFYRAHFIDGLTTAHEFAQYVQQVLNQLNWYVLDADKNTISDQAQSLAIIEKKAAEFLAADKLTIARQLRLFA